MSDEPLTPKNEYFLTPAKSHHSSYLAGLLSSLSSWQTTHPSGSATILLGVKSFPIHSIVPPPVPQQHLIISVCECLLIFTAVAGYNSSWTMLSLVPGRKHTFSKYFLLWWYDYSSIVIITHIYMYMGVWVSTCLSVFLCIIFTVGSEICSFLNRKITTQDCKDSYFYYHSLDKEGEMIGTPKSCPAFHGK